MCGWDIVYFRNLESLRELWFYKSNVSESANLVDERVPSWLQRRLRTLPMRLTNLTRAHFSSLRISSLLFIIREFLPHQPFLSYLQLDEVLWDNPDEVSPAPTEAEVAFAASDIASKFLVIGPRLKLLHIDQGVFSIIAGALRS